jgi:urease accessory protein UreF
LKATPHKKNEEKYSCMWACRIAMGKTWGINRKIAMWMYKTVFLPQILYASVVWWPVVSEVAIRNVLRSLQGSYLQAAAESMKTKPTKTLEAAICLTLLDMAVFGAARFPAYRLDSQGEWSNTRVKIYET